MDAVVKLIIIGSVIWLLQGILVIFQTRNFNSNFSDMRRAGKVVIGFNKGKLSAGTMVMIGIDENVRIHDFRCMHGVTVFAQFKTIHQLDGKNLLNLQEPDFKQFNKSIQKAIRNAVDNYLKYRQGGEFEEPRNNVVLS